MSKFLLQILKVATKKFSWNWGSWKVGLEKILWSSSCLVNLQTAGLQHYLKLSPSQVFFKEFTQILRMLNSNFNENSVIREKYEYRSFESFCIKACISWRY